MKEGHCKYCNVHLIISDFQSVKLEEEDEDEEDAPTITARPPTPPRGRKSLVEKSDNAK